VVKEANAKLERHQKIRGFSLWPGEELPRTEGTRKLKRGEIQKWARSGVMPSAGTASGGLESVLEKYVHGPITAETSLAGLALSSLDRVELLMALEQKGAIDEGAFTNARTVGDLRTLVERIRSQASTPLLFPAWNRSFAARSIRRLTLPVWILPLARVFARVRAEGLENLQTLSGPVLFAANHQSFFDGPAILDALPSRWRYRVAPAAAKEFFQAHFNPRGHTRLEWFTSSLNYYLSALFFNLFPIPQREAGARETLRYMGDLSGEGWSILIFPEGKRTETGEIGTFQPGVGMIASRLGLPVVPIRLRGLDHVLPATAKFPARGPVTVRFGAPMRLQGEDYAALAKEVESAVRSL
ncbi:MAG: 1-acyl-sn-glycerol-3-phosphate acyltransferase, partial [Acidobacteriota bacterium]|nr:1-acyl-sn-glycerol-3-phosphate acyltransferase [Acidobacteriota bacterium]